MRPLVSRAGGPIYWLLRNMFIGGRRNFVRAGRLLDLNWDFAKATMAGTPKFSYDPSVNQWTTAVDNEHWTGVGGMFWYNVSMNFIYWCFWAFWLYFAIARWYVTGKIDTFRKWKNA